MSDTTTNDVVVPLGDEVEISPRASSGTIVNNFRTGYKVQISWTVNSQDVANNKSNITVKAQLVSTGSAYTISSSATKNGSLTINGTTYSFTFTAGLSGSQTKTVYTKTVDVAHGSDGTKTVSMSASLGINVTLSGVYWGTVTASGSGTLNTIPRTSSMSLSATTATLGSTSITVNITRASTSFTHKVYCKIGSYSKQVNSGKESDTSIAFTPELTIANQIPSSTSGSATVEVQTYSGSTKIGSVTKTLQVNVPSSMVPTIGSFTATPVAAGADTSYGYVKGLSKCTLAMGSVAGSYSSTITSYSISGGGFSSTKSSFTTGALNTAGSITFTATVTDSRGRTATKTVPITVYDYAVPNISKFTVQRCNSSGTVTDDGTYLKIGTTYSFSSVNSKNSATATVSYKKSTATAWVDGGSISNNGTITIGANTIATASSYDVKITVTDKFNSTSKSTVVPTSYAIIDIRKGGKGVAFGKMSESDDLFDIGMTGLRVANARANYLRSYDNSKVAIQMTDSWLRFNPSNQFTSGIYCNTGILRTDGTLQVGASGGTFNCSSSVFTYKGNAIYHAGNKPTTADISAIKGISANGYWGMAAPDGNASNWIRTTTSGIIPYQSGGASSLGTSSWQFSTIYGKAIYENGTALTSKYVRTDTASTITSSGNALYIKAGADGNATYIVGRHTDNANKWYVGSPNANYNVHLRSVSGSVVLRGTVINCKNGDDSAYVQINSSKFNVSSQEKWKTNIQEYDESALEKILGTTIYNYDLTESNESAVGLVIERGVPQEIVSEMDRTPEVENSEMSTINEAEKDKGIDLYAMCSLSWKAIQEQQKIIESLKKRIEELENK